MEGAEFLATIYRELKFDSDGGGKVTLLFDAQQEVAIIRLLTMRNRLLKVTIQAVERYEK
jgi:hypothetical protein